MNFIGIVLGTIIGVILFLLLIALIIYKKIKQVGRDLGFDNISHIKSLVEEGEYEAKYTHKNATGMTKLLLPKIVEDFPNFSESELYNKVEVSLLSIFKSLEDKKVSNNDELVLIKGNLNEVINDLKQNKISVLYDDIKFHKHALKYYKKENGALNITVSTSLEYYYEKKIGDKIVNKKEDYKKQTSYTTEFIYVYNPLDFSKGETLVGINCPNCGAPVKSLKNKVCSYCNSGLEDINLKSWYIISYKENY